MGISCHDTTGTFESEEITHVEGDVNPVRDIEIINEELRLKDEEFLKAQIDKTERMMRSDKKVKTEYVGILLSIKLLNILLKGFFVLFFC